jgi:hypothetical protein
LSINAFSQLTGIKTVGGTSPDYATVSSAVAALSSSGVGSGGVTFRIRQGTYTGQYALGTVSGASAANPIRFAPDAANTAPVVLSFTATGSTNAAVFKLTGTDYVRFDSLTITCLGNYYARGFELKDSCNYITISGCSLSAPSSTYYSNVYSAGVYDNSDTSSHAQNVTITNNVFSGHSYGVYAYGRNAAPHQTNWIISGNNMQIHHAGIWLNYTDVTCSRNLIRNTGLYSTFYAIYGQYTYLSEYTNNDIEMSQYHSGYALYLSYCYASSGNRRWIANNTISMSPNFGGFSNGMYLYNVEHTDIVHNSVNITSGNGTGVYFYYGNFVKFQNNCIVNAAASYTFYQNGAVNAAGQTIGYNNFYGPNGASVRGNPGTNYFSVDPFYFSATDLHASSPLINKAGVPVAGVPNDIDNQVRCPGTGCLGGDSLPDIGADEFVLSAVDASSLGYDDLVFCPGSNAVYLKLMNAGTSALTALNVGWSLKTNTGSFVPQSGVALTGMNLLPGFDTLINLGNISISAGNVYQIRSYSYAPNGVSDQNTLNDTLLSSVFGPALSGIYTVGGSSPHFANLQTAIAVLDSIGVCGPVELRVRQGTYTGQINIRKISGVSASNSITIRPDTGNSQPVILEYTATGTIQIGVINFINAAYITIRGIHIRGLDSYSSRGIELLSANKHILIDSCRFYNPNNNQNNSTTNAGVFDNSGSLNSDSITIINNIFDSVSYGIHIYGNNSSNTQKGWVVNNNAITFHSHGIYIYYAEMVCGKNKIVNTGSYSMCNAIYGYYADNTTLVGNDIEMSNVLNANGIYLRNSMADSTRRPMILNNTISILGMPGGSADGLYLSGVNYIDVLHNSILLDCFSGTGLYLQHGQGINIHNNSISNLGRGYTLDQVGTVGMGGQTLSHNNYFGPNGAVIRGLSGTANKNVNPWYFSNFDLHSRSIGLYNAGLVIAGIPNDIDNDVRCPGAGCPGGATLPDIGADEFILPPNDAASVEFGVLAFCTGNNNPILRIANRGSAMLTSVQVGYALKTNAGAFVPQTGVTITGMTIAPGADTALVLNAFNVSAGNVYQLKAYTYAPNGVSDQNILNDTIVSTSFGAAASGSYTVGGTSPDFANLQSAIGFLDSHGICGPVILNIRQGTYSGRLYIGNITGANSNNTLTIRADTLNTAPVILQYSATSYTSSSVILFQDARYVNLDNITIVGLGSIYARGIEFVEENYHITISECRFYNPNNNRTDSDNCGIYNYQNYKSSDSVFVYNCVFDSVAYGIVARGPVFTPQYWIVHDNIFNIKSFGIELNYTRISCKNNVIRNIISSGTFTGIYAFRSDFSEFIGNDIEFVGVGTGKGIQLNHCSASIFNITKTVNNTISIIGMSNFGIGLDIQNVSHMNVMHNSIYFSSGNGTAVQFANGNHIKLQNNSIAYMGSQYVLYQTGVINAAGQTLSHNNLYAPNGGTVYGNAGTNNISANPLYKSVTDLHAASPLLHNAGIAITGNINDIDGNIRCPASGCPGGSATPDIGADEYYLTPRDAAVVSFQNLNPCTGNHNLYAKIRNAGTSPITSLQVGWQLKTNTGSFISQTGLSLSGINILPGTDTTINFGIINIISGSSYQIRAYSYLPSGLTDQNTSNDTLQSQVFSAAYGGAYTVGGSSPHFTDLPAAIAMLDSLGICSPVVLYVRQGTYTGQISIGTIIGASRINTLTIRPDTNNSAPVILQYSASSSTQSGVVELTDARYINMYNLEFRSLGNNYATGVKINRQCRGILIKNCIFNSPNTSTYSSSIFNSGLLKYLDGFSSDSISISACSFTGVAYGIYAYGQSSNARQKYWNIDSCTISYSRSGIYLYYTETSCRNNFMANAGSAVLGPSLYAFYCQNSEFIGNDIEISGTTASTGMQLYNCGSLNGRKMVANNTISIVSTYTISIYGMFLSIMDSVDIIHNSVNVLTPSGSGVYLASGLSTNFHNNCIAISSTRYALEQVGIVGTGRLTLSHNNYYAPNGTAVSGNGGTNNLSVFPQYTSATDLHSSSPQLHNMGKALPGNINDIDNEVRCPDSGCPGYDTLPDIGADEYFVTPYDALPTAFGNLNFCIGTNTVSLIIRNAGNTTLTSLNVGWALKTNAGAFVSQTGLSLTGMSLSPSADTVIQLGSITTASGNQYQIEAYTFSPNGMTDQYVYNDTLLSSVFVPALSGSYTVGGTSPDFPNLQTALNTLNNNGICGPVVFFVRQGTYAGELRIGKIGGASAVNTLTIRPDTNNATPVIIESSNSTATAPVLLLDSARYVYLNSLHFRHKGLNQARCIEITDNSLRISISGCHFSNPFSVNRSNTSNSGIFSQSTTVNVDSVIIRGCQFTDVAYGICSQGFTSSPRQTGWQIVDNRIQFYSNGINLLLTEVLCSNNTIICVQLNSNSFGIQVDNTAKTNIIGNKVIFNTGSFGYGIMTSGLQGTSAHRLKIANNTVTADNTSYTFIAMYLSNLDYCDVIHNSVNILAGPGYGMHLQSARNTSVHNNSIVNLGSRYTLYQTGIVGGSGLTISHNNFYGPNGAAVYGNAGSNNVSADPKYVSATDLHANSPALHNAGLIISGNLNDIDDEVRCPGMGCPGGSTAPDIGADEYLIPPHDAAVAQIGNPVLCVGNNSVTVRVVNSGANTLNSLNIGWELRTNNGPFVVQAPVSFSGLGILPAADKLLTFGNLSVISGSTYQIRVYSYLPNNNADPNTSNDTLIGPTISAGLNGHYSIGGVSPDFPHLGAAVAALKAGGMCGAVTLHIRQGTYSGQVKIDHLSRLNANDLLTLQADTQNTLPVILTYAANAATIGDKGVLVLENTRRIKISSIMFRATGTQYARGIEMLGANKQIQIVKCTFGNPNGSALGGGNNCGIYDGPSAFQADTIAISQCIFSDVSAGICAEEGSSAHLQKNWRADSNLFYMHYAGINVTNTEILCRKNIISNTGKADAAYGVYAFNARNSEFIDNTIKLTNVNSASGLYLSNIGALTTQRRKIVNNTVTISSTHMNINYGMYISGANYYDIVHNSINVLAGRAYGVALSGGNYLSFHNNNIVNAGSLHTLYQYGVVSSSGQTISHNNYYGPNGATVYGNGGTNNVSVDPVFSAPDDLHASAPGLHNAGLPLTANINDIDNEVRCPGSGCAGSASAPDIGADEFDVASRDASAFRFGALKFCAGTRPIQLRVRNGGTDTLQSVHVAWAYRTNSGAYVAQTGISLTGMQLNPGKDTTVLLGNIALAAGNTYQLRSFTWSPNGQSDQNIANDTLESHVFSVGLSGNYTVGGSGYDFPNPAAAMQYLDTNGICGPVTLHIRQGVYPGQVLIKDFAGLSASNTLTLIADTSNTSSVIITHNTSQLTIPGVIQLYNTRYIKIDGLHIRHHGINDAYGIHMVGNNHHIEISSCNFTNPYCANSISANNSGIYDDYGAQTSDSIQILENQFSQVSYGIYINGYGNSTGQTGWRIQDNRIAFNSTGLYISLTQAHCEGNELISTGFGGNVTGINCYNAASTNVIGNKIVLQSSISGKGFSLSYHSANSAQRGWVANNTISIIGMTGSNNYGMYLYNCEYLNVVHNSVNILSGQQYGVYLNGGIDVHFKNNNIVNRGSQYTLYQNGTGHTLSHNNFYGPNGATIYGNAGTNNVSVDPIYYAPDDLHASDTALNNAGLAITGIMPDIDNQVRCPGGGCPGSGTAPDIGADEFEPPLCAYPLYLSANVVGRDSVVLSWMPGGGSAWNIEWDTAGFVRGTGHILRQVSATSIGFGGLIEGKSYDFYVQDSCGGSNGLSVWIKTSVALIPCISSAGSNYGTEIDSVFFAFRKFGSPSSACRSYTHHSNPADVIQVARGNTYTLKIVNGVCSGTHTPSYVGVWIDYNRDLEYDSTEQVYASVLPTSRIAMPGLNTTIQIPTGVGLGKVNMRIVISENQRPAPCGIYSSGETEDFVLDITNPWNNDAGVIALWSDTLCPDGDSLYAIIKNFGVLPLTNVNVHWAVSENSGSYVPGTTVNWTGTLAKDSIARVFLTSRNFSPYNIYQISAYTSMPNSAVDQFQANDSLYAPLNIRYRPTIQFSLKPVCLSAPPFAPLAQPSGGNWSGRGVYGNIFYPDTATTGVGSYQLHYQVADAFGCTTTDSVIQRVDSLPVIHFVAPLAGCENDAALLLNSGRPLGGYYKGINIVGDTLKVSLAGVGTHSASYTFTDAHQCADSAQFTIEVYPKPLVSLGSFPDICENAPAINLTGGTPNGGTYSGKGVSANSFDPAIAGVGITHITYRYTDTNMCSDSADTVITVLTIPAVSLAAFSPVCDNKGNVALSGGVPAGGTYGGKYVAGSTFRTDSAGPGSHLITYSYTDTNSCSDSSSQTLDVEASPVFSLGNDTVICRKQKLTLDPGLVSMVYLWSTGDTTQTIVVSNDGSYWVKVSDLSTANNCNHIDTVVVSIESTCVGISESLAAVADIRYYPNPNAGRFTLRAEGLDGMEVRLTVLDGLGKLVKEEVFAPAGAVLEQVIDLSGAGAGIYYLNLHTERGVATHMITLRR